MSPSPHERRRVWPRSATCARVWTSIGNRLRNDARPATNLALDHSRVSAPVESLAGHTLPLLSQLLLLCAYRHRTPRRFARHLAGSAPPPTLSPLSQGRLRPCAGQENDQCLIPA